MQRCQYEAHHSRYPRLELSRYGSKYVCESTHLTKPYLTDWCVADYPDLPNYLTTNVSVLYHLIWCSHYVMHLCLLLLWIKGEFMSFRYSICLSHHTYQFINHSRTFYLNVTLIPILSFETVGNDWHYHSLFLKDHHGEQRQPTTRTCTPTHPAPASSEPMISQSNVGRKRLTDT